MMKVLTQFSLFLAGKPGLLASICRELGKTKVNIEAMTMMDAQEHGVLRLIVSDPEKARPVLRKLSVQVAETEILAVPMSNRPGAVADVLEKLSAHHVHISYAYCTASTRGGKALGAFKVGDVKKAIKVLNSKRSTNRDMKVKLRRPQVARR
ncbi:MAG: amino acid-binding protein [bacterium]|nr:amino acid-binding protein [bacterium]